MPCNSNGVYSSIHRAMLQYCNSYATILQWSILCNGVYIELCHNIAMECTLQWSIHKAMPKFCNGVYIELCHNIAMEYTLQWSIHKAMPKYCNGVYIELCLNITMEYT